MVDFAKLTELHRSCRDAGHAWYVDRQEGCAFVDVYPANPFDERFSLRGPAVAKTREEAIALGIDPEMCVIHWRVKTNDADKI